MKTETTENIPNSFEGVLRNQRKGALLAEISQAVQTAVLSVQEHCKQATVTLVLTIAPANGDASALSVSDEIKSKLPQAPRTNTLFYATDDGRLVRNDPNQEELEFKVAKEPPKDFGSIIEPKTPAQASA